MRFRISGTVTISCFTEVEADSVAQALEIAEERDMARLSHNACQADDRECWCIDAELDGTPMARAVYQDGQNEPAWEAP